MFDRRSPVSERRAQARLEQDGTAAAAAPQSAWTNVLFDRAPVPMWIVDRESARILAVNDSAVARYGYSRDEFLGLRSGDIDEGAAGSRGRSAEGASGLAPWSSSRRHRWRDGTTREVSVVEEDVRFRGREARVVMVDDVSERVDAEQSRALLLAAIDHLDEIVFLVRPEPDALGPPRIVFVNAAVERVLGIPRPGIAAASYHRPASPALTQIEELVTKGLGCDAPSRCEVEWRSPQGRLHCLELSAVPLRVSDRDSLSHWAVIARDLTAQRALTDRSSHAQRLESLGLLAGSTAHDFNNLMHVVTGFSELALAQLPPGGPTSTYVQQAHEAALRASSLAKQLLAFSRRQSVKSVRVDMRTILNGLQPMLERLAGPRVKVSVRGGETPAFVCGDPTQLEQIVLNLVVNARDAQPSGGRVDVALDLVDAGTAAVAPAPGSARDAAPGRWVRVRVTDAGPGMSPELRARVFEPFFTTKSQGTGLGLSTVHRIAKEGGGTVRLDSPEEGGLQVEVLLPEDAPPAAG
jgi:two-component system cell cycle sensor histidine kinase/response regulator CckA